jgi:hypothetical protein
MCSTTQAWISTRNNSNARENNIYVQYITEIFLVEHGGVQADQK